MGTAVVPETAWRPDHKRIGIKGLITADGNFLATLETLKGRRATASRLWRSPGHAMPDWRKRIDEWTDRHFKEIVATRRHLHAHPEPSGEEQETSLYLYQLFSDRGFDVRMGPEGRGLMVDRKGQPEASRVAIRADIDALRIQDRKDVQYRSQSPGIMHACGHDAHTAIVTGVLLVLQNMEAAGQLPWPVPLRGIFQPSEETITGANEMIQVGAIEGIEAIFATHVDPTRLTGRVGTRHGLLTSNSDSMQFIIRGRGGHAARPHESDDPIAAAAQLISTLYLFVPRVTDSQDSVVVTIGQINGGDNPNVIPERVELQGTLRTLSHEVREKTINHIRQLARGIEEVSANKIEVRFEVGTNSVDNDPVLNDLVRRAASEVLGEDHVETISRPSMGSEDFAMYLDHIPGVMFRLGCARDADAHNLLHTATFDIDEDAMRFGTKILARSIVAWSAPEAYQI